jgi:hypothetical protein
MNFGNNLYIALIFIVFFNNNKLNNDFIELIEEKQYRNKQTF